jgi:hypothetical protein
MIMAAGYSRTSQASDNDFVTSACKNASNINAITAPNEKKISYGHWNKGKSGVKAK